ncbi:MAG TPA: hypothetical protein VLW49_00705 [Gaiellaceae bacterium]|nr:hypothetical protein [Gaiellaceae bacterium]
MTKAAAVVALVLSLAAGCGGGGRPHFEGASGWHVIAEPGQIVSAANVAFAAADRAQSAPIHTVASLPRRGILIWVQSARGRKLKSVPLRVEYMATSRPEGFACPGTTRALQTGRKGWDVYVWVFFGAKHPPESIVAAANAELARFSF